MDATSNLKLINYIVEKSHFDLNCRYDFGKLRKIQITPKFDRRIEKKSDDSFKLTLSVRIASDLQKDEIPFFAECVIGAVFKMSDWEKPENKFYVCNNTTAIIFPFLRALLANTTINANLPPYTLPVMNINKLFETQEIV